MNMRRSTWERRFWERVERTESCWLWRGCLVTGGYGVLKWQRSRQMAHRVAYEMLRGPIPDGLVLDHLCRVRHCVNPDHLEPVDQGINLARGLLGYQLRGDVCKNGHDVSEPGSTRRNPNAPRARRCVACALNRRRELNELIRRARLATGLKQRDYVRQYGSTRAVAERVIAEAAST